MENDPRKLNLLTPLIAIVIITIIIVVLFAFLSRASETRKKEVHYRYYEETQQWITKNQKELEAIFTEGMKYDCKPNELGGTCGQNESIAGRLTQDITDFSSIMFLKNDGGRLLTMQLSGIASELYQGHEKTAELNNIAKGKTDTLPWDEYLYELQGKEVLVPVKKDGKTIGVIIRGVIEK